MSAATPGLGLGIGWRPELALFIERREQLGFVEVVAENMSVARLPDALVQLRERGVAIVPHGISLSLGGAEPLDRARLDVMARLAERVDAPLVSEHIAFVRAGGKEAGHLLPVARTRVSLEVLVENVEHARRVLPVPLALENISAILDWPGAEMTEDAFVRELLERTGAFLLLDVANVYANSRNLGGDATELMMRMPLERLAYVHMGGGVERGGVYHDTHAHPVPPEALALLESLCARAEPPGVMLERDDDFPDDLEISDELDAIAGAVQRGRERALSAATS